MSNFVLPSEWADDKAMDVLFAPFRGSRDVNPKSWDSKMKFWREVIHSYCANKRILTFDIRNLVQAFERNEKMPSCLNVVIDDLRRQGLIQSVSDYYAETETSWLSWSLKLLVKKPFQWSYNNIVKNSISWAYGLIHGNQNSQIYHSQSQVEPLIGIPEEQYVFMDLAKSAADAIYQRHLNSVMYHVTDNIISYSSLQNNCRDICVDDRSFNIAVLELVRQKLCCVTTNSNGEQLIRMITDKKDAGAPLSDTEEKIYRLKITGKQLEEDIIKITEEIEECRKSAKAFLHLDRKPAALKCLRRKKMLTRSLSQKEEMMDKIYALTDSIQQTESQKQFIDALTTGIQAFKQITEQHGLNEAKIDDTMVSIQEVLEASEQMTQAMAQPLEGMTELSDSELESELDQILKIRSDNTSTHGRQEVPEMDFSLPNVPLYDLSSTASTVIIKSKTLSPCHQ